MADVDLQFEGTDFTKSYSAREILGFLQNITYGELPEQVRLFFENKFSKFVQDPGVQQILNTLRIHFQPRGYQEQDAEYFKDENVIEWYGGKWYEFAGKGYFPKTYTPEMVRREFINEFMNRTLIHELVHVLQNYYDTQTERPEAIAPYPAEDHPEYYNYGDVYKRDPGEQQARDIANKFDFETNKRFRKLHSLEFSNVRLGWKTGPDKDSPKEDWVGWKVRIIHHPPTEAVKEYEGVVQRAGMWDLATEEGNKKVPVLSGTWSSTFSFTVGNQYVDITPIEYVGLPKKESSKLSWKTGPDKDSPKEDWLGWKVKVEHFENGLENPSYVYEGVVTSAYDGSCMIGSEDVKGYAIAADWSSDCHCGFFLHHPAVKVTPIEYVGLPEKESVLKFIDAVAV